MFAYTILGLSYAILANQQPVFADNILHTILITKDDN